MKTELIILEQIEKAHLQQDELPGASPTYFRLEGWLDALEWVIK